MIARLHVLAMGQGTYTGVSQTPTTQTTEEEFVLWERVETGSPMLEAEDWGRSPTPTPMPPQSTIQGDADNWVLMANQIVASGRTPYSDSKGPN